MNDGSEGASQKTRPSPNSLIGGLQGKGFVWFWIKRGRRFSERALGVWERFRRSYGAAVRSAWRLIRFYAWLFPSTARLVSGVAPGKQRLLLIHDFSAQPFSIGDVLILQEVSLVLLERSGFHATDIAFVYDPNHPGSQDPIFATINKGNVMYHLLPILAGAQVNEHLGSVFVFNSHEQLHKFIGDNADFYHLWPAGWHSRTTYLHYEIFNELLYSHYNNHGRIPHLSCPQFLLDWANGFYCKYADRRVPVTVQARNNKNYHPHRNIRIECWLEFFRYCEARYPATFTVICAPGEVDDRMRKRSNVIIAKDHTSGLDHDLALIQTAAIHMGAASGPSIMAMFNLKPYFLFAHGEHAHAYKGIIQEGTFFRHPFATTHQRWTMESESAELLIGEFERMWSATDTRAWTDTSSGNRSGEKCVTYLR